MKQHLDTAREKLRAGKDCTPVVLIGLEVLALLALLDNIEWEGNGWI